MARRPLAVLALVAASACAPHSGTPRAVRTMTGTPRAPLADLEQRYLAVREIADQVDITRSLPATISPRGVPLAALEHRLDSARAPLITALDATSADALSPEDQRALMVMRQQAHRGFTITSASAPNAAVQPVCTYDTRALYQADSGRTLQARMNACYTFAAHNVRVGDSTFDRLSVLGRLSNEPDAARRRTLFLALDTVWRSVNGDDGPESPYRLLLPGQAARWKAGHSPTVEAARLLGVPADSVESWLVSVLSAWRDATAGAAGADVEPWNFYFVGGAADRRLASRAPLDQLAAINSRYYASLGADLSALNVHFDLVSRPGKTAVAYTTFGGRPRATSTGWSTGEPWVFATYTSGGIGNLNELLHESGHAVHIAAIHTRPALDDWPDSDTWTEALGDIVSLDVYEPAWQLRWLGDSVSTREALRAKYAAVVLDVAWSLFEIRVRADPARDPNVVWNDLTHRYLHVVPHPELSWWAMRGQLVDSPSYMLNYALGAMIIADVRATLRAQRGDWTRGDPGWYAYVSDRLYRFGLERPSREVIADFLGRPFSPAALLSDLARMRAAPPPPPH